jgi:hypothetical protein
MGVPSTRRRKVPSIVNLNTGIRWAVSMRQ